MALEILFENLDAIIDNVTHFFEPIEHQYEAAEHAKHKVEHANHKHGEHKENKPVKQLSGVKTYTSGLMNKAPSRNRALKALGARLSAAPKKMARAATTAIKQSTAGGIAKSGTEMVLGIKTSIFALMHHNAPAFVLGHQFPSAIKAASELVGGTVDMVWNTPKNIKNAAKNFAQDVKTGGVKHAMSNAGKDAKRASTEFLIRSGKFAAGVGKDLANDFVSKPPVGCLVCGVKSAVSAYKEAKQEKKTTATKRPDYALYKASAAFFKSAGKVAVDGYFHHGPLKYAISGVKGLAKIAQNQYQKIRDNVVDKQETKRVAKEAKQTETPPAAIKTALAKQGR